MNVWFAITDCGDSALLLPLMAWMALSLLLFPGDRRLGLRWIAAVGATGAVVALSKLLFMGWGIGAGLPWDYTGFSGHTALSMLTWPTLAVLLARHRGYRQQQWALALGLLLGLSIAVSRLIVKAHSPCEVILGAALALLVGAWFQRDLRRGDAGAAMAVPSPPLPRAETRQVLLLAAGWAALMLFCYGRVFPSQHVLKELALWCSGRTDVFTRRLSLG
jgi:membrane-associated phospholipid phosphatase